MTLQLQPDRFADEHGRTVLLRGVNLGGSSKVPFTPDGATWRREGFFDHRNVSFVGRPFPLEQADEHFSRLKRWGFTFLRFLVTWEAVEHAGPGQYDEDYLDYLAAVVREAGRHGLTLFIDPHEDVWSRFSGGDGAPGWTFAAAGLDLTRFDEAGAAINHAIHGDPLPRMIWPTNNERFAAATMWTLFFAGDRLAPRTQVDGEPIQQYLQRHYFAAMRQVALRLRGMEHVVGYDTLNEPSPGYIGCSDLRVHMSNLRIGPMPTPWQSMLLASGIPQEVDVFELRVTGPKRTGTRLLNPRGVSAWLPGRTCIWREHGIWDVDERGQPRLLRPDYFAGLDFLRDCFKPFANRYAREIREVEPRAWIFVEGHGTAHLPEWGPQDAPGIVAAPHWYDGIVLLFKNFVPWLGSDSFAGKAVVGAWRVRRSYRRQIERLRQFASEKMNRAPLLIGEVGIAFDLKGKEAYRTGDFRPQERALDRTMRALEDALVSFTLWNYTADNTNARGDQWNDEDLSIFSRDQQRDPSDPDSGGRALPALVRPYARATAGQPLCMNYHPRSRRFTFRFRHDPQVAAPTEIFIPPTAYPHGIRVRVSDGTWEYDPATQTLYYRHTSARAEHWIQVKPAR